MSETEGTNYLDLDALAGQDTFSFKYKGKTHVLKETTVDDFIENTALLQNLRTDGDLKAEVDVMKKLIVRAFPSITVDEIGTMTVKQMNRLVEFSRQYGGERDTQTDAAAANPQTPAS